MSAIDQELREAVKGLCSKYPEDYWQARDRDRSYPEAFVRELTEAGYLACLIPEAYGGAGLWSAKVRGDGGDQPLRQLSGLPRADKDDGHRAEARLGRAEAALAA
jgi:alkylation response protein AidB-like acyl-CoA dehydrogenase